MNTDTLAITQVLIPTIVGVLIYCYHVIFHLLPVKDQQALARFAPQATQTIEQVYTSASGQEKKALALSLTKVMLRTFKSKIPSDEVIGAAIESAVFAFKNQVTLSPPPPAATSVKLLSGQATP